MIKRIAVFDDAGKQVSMTLEEFADLFDVKTCVERNAYGNWIERRVIVVRRSSEEKT